MKFTKIQQQFVDGIVAAGLGDAPGLTKENLETVMAATGCKFPWWICQSLPRVGKALYGNPVLIDDSYVPVRGVNSGKVPAVQPTAPVVVLEAKIAKGAAKKSPKPVVKPVGAASAKVKKAKKAVVEVAPEPVPAAPVAKKAKKAAKADAPAAAVKKAPVVKKPIVRDGDIYFTSPRIVNLG